MSIITPLNWIKVLKGQKIKSIRAHNRDTRDVYVSLQLANGEAYEIIGLFGSQITGALINITAQARPIRSIKIGTDMSGAYLIEAFAAHNRSQFMIKVMPSAQVLDVPVGMREVTDVQAFQRQ